MRRGHLQFILGLTGAVASLGGFFWYGITYRVFGGQIRADAKTFIFAGWILLAFFCFGFAGHGIKGGLKAAGSFAGLALAALGIGILLGHYR